MITVTIYPVLIAPLFNKFTELPEGELRSEINALAKRVTIFDYCTEIILF